MRGITHQDDPALRTDPSGKRVTKHKFPIHETAFRSCSDDGVDNGCPSFDGPDSVFYVTRSRPALFYVCFILRTI
jgi:hypothetical protein